MAQNHVEQWTIKNVVQDDTLITWLDAFFVDRKAQNLSAGTLYFYRTKLSLFTAYCQSQVITRIGEMTSDSIRRYLLYLEEGGHNPGGIHACYRALRAFLLWFEAETEPDGWQNPIKRVKAPRVSIEPIQPVELDTVRALIQVCKGEGFTALRDKTLLLFLLDTGARAAEVCALNIADVELTGSILIRQGKGRKPRTVYMGQKTRRAVRAYLKARQDSSPALWTTAEGDRLTYWGLNLILTRRAKQASVPKPDLHDFRRAFALNFLRNNPGDIYSLQRLMGHTDFQVLRRYLAQTDQDIQSAHRRGSPVDNAF